MKNKFLCLTPQMQGDLQAYVPVSVISFSLNKF